MDIQFNTTFLISIVIKNYQKYLNNNYIYKKMTHFVKWIIHFSVHNDFFQNIQINFQLDITFYLYHYKSTFTVQQVLIQNLI